MPAILIPPMVFVTTALFVLALFPPRPRTIGERLAPYGPRRALVGRERELARSLVSRVLAPTAAGVVGRVTALAPDRIREDTETWLDRAGQPMTVSTFLMLRAAVMFGLPLLYVVLVIAGRVQLTPLVAAMTVLLFWAGQRLPSYWLRRRARARERRIERALPGAMDLITISMEAGLAFDAALAKVVEKTSGPLRDEFERVLQEMTLGKPRRDALRDLGKRVRLQDMTSLVTAVVQADQMGLGLGNVMRGLADELRTKRRQRAEEEAMKAPVKMLFPLIFCIFPSMMLVVVGPAIIIIFTRVISTISGS